MSKGIIFSFLLGAGVGSLATWVTLRKEYERRTQEEIDSVKEVFARRRSNDSEEPKAEPVNIDISEAKAKAEAAREKPSITEYAAKLQDQGYVNYSEMAKHTEDDIEEEEDEEVEKPYVISPDEFGDIYGYDCISLTYYSDGVLTDDDDEPIEDVDSVVGAGFASHFGEYEDDSVFVRNNRRKVDYEILKDRRKYADVKAKMTRSAED